MKMIDLFSGLGGASEAFLKAGWDVLRVDNNELLKDVPHTIMADLTDIPLIDSVELWPSSAGFDFVSNARWSQPDLVWASPPCTDFSLAFNAPGPKAKREGRDFEPDMKPLEAAIRLIKHFKPRYWVIENVHGASKIFSRELGVNAPRQIIGPYFLWGNFPFLPHDLEWEKTDKSKLWEIDNPLRANLRGKIPLEISEALLNEIMYSPSLEKWT